MKKLTTIPVAIALGVLLYLGASFRNPDSYTPVFMARAELEKSVSFTAESRAMENPGKIVVRGNQLFINEKYKGVHIVDNSDPGNPVFKAFIVAPGCLDMAVKDQMIYLDNAVDLVAFDLDTKTVTERIRNFMPEHLAPDGRRYYYEDRPEGFVLVGWKENSANR